MILGLCPEACIWITFVTATNFSYINYTIMHSEILPFLAGSHGLSLMSAVRFVYTHH